MSLTPVSWGNLSPVLIGGFVDHYYGYNILENNDILEYILFRIFMSVQYYLKKSKGLKTIQIMTLGP